MFTRIKYTLKSQKRKWSRYIFAVTLAMLFLVTSVAVAVAQRRMETTSPTSSNNSSAQSVDSPRSPAHTVDKFITVYGQKIHYVEAGRGPTVILLHGLSADISQWANLIGPLSKKYRVIALDQIGHGQSGRPFINYRINTLVDFLEGFYKELKVERASLIGESLGGATAAAFALTYPQQVERLVLVDAGYGYALPEVSNPRLLGHRPGTLHLLGPSTRSEARQLLALVTYDKQTVASDAVVDEIFASTMRSGYTIQRFIESFARREDVLDNRLQALKLPTLIIWGRQDILSPLALGERFKREIAGSQLVIIDNCGHAPPNECPTEFNTAVIRFLDGTNAEGRTAETATVRSADNTNPDTPYQVMKTKLLGWQENLGDATEPSLNKATLSAQYNLKQLNPE